MNKKRICIVCVIMVFGIMAGCFLEKLHVKTDGDRYLMKRTG